MPEEFVDMEDAEFDAQISKNIREIQPDELLFVDDWEEDDWI